MENWRRFLLLVIAVSLILVIILTWGSIGSITLLFCLIMLAGSLLYQRYLTNHEENDFDMEQ